MPFAADEAAEEVLEAWSLSVAWTTDAHGNEHPTLAMGSSRSGDKAVPIASKPKYTTAYVRKASQTMMRQLMSMLQTMPELPALHWLSMKLLYREEVTPADYEPEGFEPSADIGLSFKTKPMMMTVNGTCTTLHNSLGVSCIFADSSGGGADPDAGVVEAGGVWRVRAGGGGGASFECGPVATVDAAASAMQVATLATNRRSTATSSSSAPIASTARWSCDSFIRSIEQDYPFETSEPVGLSVKLRSYQKQSLGVC